jgi:hypothetical protein
MNQHCIFIRQTLHITEYVIFGNFHMKNAVHSVFLVILELIDQIGGHKKKSYKYINSNLIMFNYATVR